MKILSIATAAVTALCCTASLSARDKDWAALNSHLYEFGEVKVTPAPGGYKPVYVSHYGRHGARTGIKTVGAYDKLLDILRKASAQKQLTAEGDSLYNEVRFVRTVYDDMEGRLLPSGQQEQHRLAEQIYGLYPEVFSKKNCRLRAESSTVQRSIVSGTCFVQTLTSLNPGLEMTFDTGEKYINYINNGCSPEHRKDFNRKIDSLRRSHRLDGKEVLGRLFKDTAKGAEIVGDANEFQRLVYVAACNGKASGLTADMFRHMSDEAVRTIWAEEITSIYMRNGNSLEYGDGRMKRTEPLVRVMLSQAREALLCGNADADLKFGHDFPLAALASYFGLDGIGDRMGWNSTPGGWDDPMILPYSSNLQMVIYGKKGAEPLVKFVYNSRERSLSGLQAVSGPYYRWKDVYERFMPECDERTFTLADWNWRDEGNGAQSGYAQMDLFNSKQSISVLRYPMSSHRTFIANDGGPEADSTSALAARHGGKAAINGSYFNVKKITPTTYTLDDGKVEGRTGARELRRVDGIVAIKGHRTVKILSVPDTASYRAAVKGFSEALASGPVLRRDGAEARLCWPSSSFYTLRHPRTLIGTTADGWVYLVVIDGRFPGEGIGATIHETAEIARLFGLRDALNLDGGGSSTLWTAERGVISHPYDNHKFDHAGQRTVPNIIYIRH